MVPQHALLGQVIIGGYPFVQHEDLWVLCDSKIRKVIGWADVFDLNTVVNKYHDVLPDKFEDEDHDEMEDERILKEEDHWGE